MYYFLWKNKVRGMFEGNMMKSQNKGCDASDFVVRAMVSARAIAVFFV
jgi:hypothetical protein